MFTQGIERATHPASRNLKKRKRDNGNLGMSDNELDDILVMFRKLEDVKC